MASTSSSDPLRPSDHVDGDASVTQPRLGPVGYLRFFWRQLTSMRTALFLLLLLAIAAIPGSLVPQVTSDPNGVVQYKRENPELSAVLDALGVFSTYSSVWFSAIYLLLFVSLIGCVIPRTKHHFEAMRARPPKTPARLQRLEGYTTRELATDAQTAVTAAATVLRRQGYRVERYGDSISAERGYLRETGNLVFHTALIGVLVTVGVGGGFGYTGQRVVVEGYSFTNSLISYESFSPGRFFSEEQLVPFSISLDDFAATYVDPLLDPEAGITSGQALDFTASVTATVRGQEPAQHEIKVNSPLEIGGTQVYLLGNGYAPELIVRDPEGNVVFSDPTPFLPQNSELFSVGVIKVPDGLDEQIGMTGLFYPTAAQRTDGAWASVYPDLIDPLLTLEVYTGDLGLDEGRAVNAYALNTDDLEQIAGRDAQSPTIELGLGDRADLPNGLGTVELAAIPRFVSFDVHHDSAQGWVLLFAGLALAGLIASLFVPRRRMWVKAVPAGDGMLEVQYAGLAKGDDPALAAAVADLADRHTAAVRVDP